jgi:hypothetical protein
MNDWGCVATCPGALPKRYFWRVLKITPVPLNLHDFFYPRFQRDLTQVFVSQTFIYTIFVAFNTDFR